jgi:hypothetical protein
MGFAIIFNVGDIYYQQQIVGRLIFCGTHAQPPTTLWTFLHLILSIAMLFFAVSIKMVYSQECESRTSNQDRTRVVKDEFFMCVSASVALIIIFFLRMTHKGLWYKGKQVRVYSYLVRFFVAFSCSFIPYLSLSPLGTIATLFVFTSVLILQVDHTHSLTSSLNLCLCLSLSLLSHTLSDPSLAISLSCSLSLPHTLCSPGLPSQDLFSHRGLRDPHHSNHKSDDIPPDRQGNDGGVNEAVLDPAALYNQQSLTSERSQISLPLSFSPSPSP